MRITIEVGIYITAMVGVLLFGVMGAYIIGQAGGFNVPIRSPITALYFTIETISTVGFGDIVPVTGEARIFTMVLIVLGISVFLSGVTIIARDFMDSRIEKFSGRMPAIERRFVNGHVLLIGNDSTNMRLAERLKAAKRRFVIVVSDHDDVTALRRKGYSAYFADATTEAGMGEFRPDRAASIIIDVKDNAKTTYVALVAKTLAKRTKIIVIAHERETEERLKELGITHVISPASMAADVVGGLLG